MSRGYTLMEILIVIGVLAVIGASVPITLNYKTQIDKGNNTKIKNELATIQRAFENFYNDKKRYPKPEEICFDTPSNEVYLDDRGNRSKICHICGTKISHTSYPNLKNYLSNAQCFTFAVIITCYFLFQALSFND